MLRKFSILGIFLIFMTSTLLGASCISKPGGSGPTEEITLTVWRLFDNKEVFDPIIANYQASHPNIKINYVKMDYNEYELKTSEALAAGEGPDIWMIRDDWMPRDYKKLVPMTDGLMAQPSQNKSDVDVYKEKFAPIAASENIIDNKIYGIPLSIDTLALYYNFDIFQVKSQELYSSQRGDEAKLFEKSPANWDDLISIIKLLTEKNGKNITKSTVALGTASNIDKHDDILYALMLQNSTPMVSADKLTATFNLTIPKSSGGVVYPGTNALDFYTSFANPNKEVYTWNNSLPNSVQAFMDGKTAMLFHYSFIQKNFLEQKPTLNYRFGPLPQIKGATKAIDYTSYWTETVTKNSKHPKEAWEFIIYCATEANDKYTTATKRPNPYRVDTSSLPTDIEMRATRSQDTFTFQKMTAQTWYKGIRADNVDNIFSNMIENVITFGQPSQSAIDTAAADVTKILQSGGTPPNTTADTTSTAPSTATK